MSKSRSPTPTPNTFLPTNITTSSESTSRPQPHENTPSTQSIGGREQISSPRTTHSLRSISTRTSSHLSRTAESPPEQQPMAKRFRRSSPGPRSRGGTRSSPSSDSQDDMADTEMDGGRTQSTEAAPLAVAPPKKKRTRTLTTPHQSSVLHALLAQSRFPTTAVREEVGRSIGLSARKVQIWFQNQRQKARRPHNQGDTSQKRPPQFGPFPAEPDTSDASTFSRPFDQGTSLGTSRMYNLGGAGFEERRPEGVGYSGQHSSESFSSSVESPSHLLGPGMPGSDLPPVDLPHQGRPSIPLGSIHPSNTVNVHSFTSLPYSTPTHHTLRSPSPLNPFSLPSSRPTTAGRQYDRDFSRTLPPLVFGTTANGPNFSAPETHSLRPIFSRSATTSLYAAQRSSSPETYYPSEGPLRSTTIPPPYTLQPTPQWDNLTLPSAIRPEALPWSRSSSRTGRESRTPPPHPTSTTAPSGRQGEASPPEVEGPPRPRLGRYDPVRAIFIHTIPTEPSPPQQSTGHEDTSI